MRLDGHGRGGVEGQPDQLDPVGREFGIPHGALGGAGRCGVLVGHGRRGGEGFGAGGGGQQGHGGEQAVAEVHEGLWVEDRGIGERGGRGTGDLPPGSDRGEVAVFQHGEVSSSLSFLHRDFRHQGAVAWMQLLMDRPAMKVGSSIRYWK